MTAHASGYRVRLWVAGDWNGFFGLFSNVVLNVIVLSGLCLGVVQLPGDLVFGRILPGLGIGLPIGNLSYAYLACRLAQQEKRADVTAMPYGPSVPHMFIVVFLIMLPVALKTKDPILAWRAGLAWCLVIGVIVLLGAFVGPTIRKYTPRAAMLGTLAGISIAFISMRPAFQSFEVPWIAFVSLAIILVSWTANIRLRWGIPGGLAAALVGTVIAWVVSLLGISGYMQPTAVGQALAQFGLRLPTPTADVFAALSDIGPLLITAVPLGIYNFTEGLNNVESAAARGGVGALVGHRAAADHRRSARHLQFHRGHEQRRKRRRRGRQLRPAPHPPRRRHRRRGRRVSRQPVSAGGLYRPSRMESRGRPHRLFAGDRAVHRRDLLSRPDGAAARGDPAGRDPADPALYRPRHRRPGIPGHTRKACTGRDPGDHPQHRGVGADPDRRGLDRRRNLGRASRLRQARRHGCRLSRPGAARRRRRAGRHDAGCHRRLHHRPRFQAGDVLRHRGGNPRLFRLHPRRPAGARCLTDGGAGLSSDGGNLRHPGTARTAKDGAVPSPDRYNCNGVHPARFSIY